MRVLFLAAALFVAGATHAATPFEKGTGVSTQRFGGTTSVFTNGGAANVPMTPPTSNTMTIPPGWATGHANGGKPHFETRFPLPLPDTTSTVPVKARVPVTPPSYGKAIGNFAKKFGPLGQGMAVYELLNELGIVSQWSAAEGENKFQRQNTNTAWGWDMVHFNQPECSSVNFTGFVGSAATAGARTAQAKANCWTALDPSVGWNVVSHRPDNAASYAEVDLPSFPHEFMYVRVVIANTINGGQHTDLIPVKRVPQTEVEQEQLTEEQVANEIANKSGWPSSSAVSRALADAVNAGQKVEVEKPIVSPEQAPIEGPADVQFPSVNTTGQPVTTTTNNPDGSVTTTTTTPSTTTQFPGNDTARHTTTTTTTTSTRNPDGSTTQGPTTTTTSTPDKPPEEKPKDPCGLPDTPKCKIDETGTPDKETLDGKKEAEDQNKELRDFVTDPKSKLPAFPTLSWAFSMPTGCAPFPLGAAFAPYITELNICPYQEVFHDIMSVVWIIGGLFGAISMFWRSTFSAN